jgi:hypothetical protein
MHRVSAAGRDTSDPETFDPCRRWLVAAAMAAPLQAWAARAVHVPRPYVVVELGHDLDPELSTGALAVDNRGIAAGWVGEVPAVFTSDGRAQRIGDRAGRAIGFDRQGRLVGRHFGSDDAPAAAFVRHGATLIDRAPVDALPDSRASSSGAGRGALALPHAFFSEVYARNRHGDAVGTSDTGAGTAARAVLRRGQGRPIDLGALPEVRQAGWHRLIVAYGINDAGTIVGVGERGAPGLRGFMLVPGAPARLVRTR